MVAVEDAAGLVAGDVHGHPFRHPRRDEVPDRGPAEVVAEHARAAGLSDCDGPGSLEVFPQLAHVGAGEVREQERHHPAVGPFEHLHPVHLLHQGQLELGRELHHPAVVVLRRAGLQPERPRGDCKLTGHRVRAQAPGIRPRGTSRP